MTYFVTSVTVPCLQSLEMHHKNKPLISDYLQKLSPALCALIVWYRSRTSVFSGLPQLAMSRSGSSWSLHSVKPTATACESTFSKLQSSASHEQMYWSDARRCQRLIGDYIDETRLTSARTNLVQGPSAEHGCSQRRDYDRWLLSVATEYADMRSAARYAHMTVYRVGALRGAL